MSKLITVPVSGLTGAALDWSVALADDWRSIQGEPMMVTKNDITLAVSSSGLHWELDEDACYSPSTNWDQCGPLRDKYRVSLEESVYDKRVVAQCWDDGEGNIVIGFPSVLGTDARVAICRAVVIANLGDTVDIPVVLLGEI